MVLRPCLYTTIVRLGTSFQMVKDIFRISKHYIIFIVSQCNAYPAMLFWQRGVSYEKSSEVSLSPCEHISSDEDCSSRITTADSSSSIRIASHGVYSVTSN